MARHECCDCRHMKYMEDEYSRTYYFCMFSQSPCFLEETGMCGECELSGWEEQVYQEAEERLGT